MLSIESNGGVWRGGVLHHDRLKGLGIEPGYFDYKGRWQDVPESTLETVAALMTRSPARPAPLSIRAGEHHPLDERADLLLEDGTVLEGISELPEDLPWGYHRISAGPEQRLLIVSPGRCYMPDDLRSWGWMVQLYALRSRTSWGIGDLGDLETFGRAAARAGAGVVLLNPLHADKPGLPRQPSPYFPSSRCFRDPAYLDVEGVAGAAGLSGFDGLVAGGRALGASDRVDRDGVYAQKMELLERLWVAAHDNPDLVGSGPQDDNGLVTRFATHCALVERYGRDLSKWPASMRRPGTGEVDRFRAENEERVRFHAWLQDLVDEQLHDAARTVGLIHDLAIGVDPHGADAWMWPESFAEGVSIGAPPDDYNSEGQDWGVAGFDPVGLAAADYEPFIAMVRATMRHAAGIRFDHVMGMFRLFWIPEGSGPAEGCYVRYPARELLDILALESHRAGAFVVGEDLGTVEEGVHDETALRAMLSVRLLWFEDSDAGQLPRLSMAAANTHDLPTTAGLWTGADLERQRSHGSEPNAEFLDAMVGRIRKHLGVEQDATVAEVIDRASELLARSDSAVVMVAVEDVVEGIARYNLPGTTGDQNWTTVLPIELEELVHHPRFAAISEIFTEGRS